MRKKKKLYIVLIVIATVALLADAIVFAASNPSTAGGRGREVNAVPSGEMPEGMESGEKPEMPEGMKSGSFGTVRIICIVVGIICIIIDLFCGIRLFKLLKTEKAKLLEIMEDEKTGESIMEILDPAEERMKMQKRNRRRMIAGFMVLLSLALILQVFGSRVKEDSSVSVQEEVITAQAENGEVSQSLKSSGVLEAADNESITIPGDITVTNFFVSNGDTVDEGDAVASVDRNSVMAAITDVQDLIDEVDAQISAQKDAAISSSLKATVGGTVVAVYAKEDQEVVDIMYEKGALALISLDDLLAVTIENPGNLTVGGKVTVSDEDGNLCTGKVAAIEKETVEITVSLDDMDYNEKITVKDSEGNKIGAGKLYVYSQQKITGYSGTISDVRICKGDTVTEGTTLFTLSNTDYTAAYQTLMNKRIVLEDQYNCLVEIASTGYVYVKEAGTISGIDEGLLKTSTIVGMSYTESGDEENTDDNPSEDTESEKGETTDTQTVATISKTVNVVWLNADGTVMQDDQPESISIQLFANGEAVDTIEITAQEEWTYTWTGLAVTSEDGTEITYTIAEKDLEAGYTTSSQVSGSVTVIINTKENTMMKNDAGNEDSESKDSERGQQYASKNQMTESGSGTSRGFSVSGAAGNVVGSAVSETEEEETPSYVYGETTICALTPDDGVKIDITIDELDILNVSMEQKCEITLDAFPGQSFEGVVTGINQAGTNSGGNTKYTVTVSLNKADEMLLGMNASVKMTMKTEENVLRVPEEALVEQEGKVYVYTEYDKKNDELGGLLEVTTGLSDGQNVQITGGLESGQDYYYRFADTISYSFIR